MKRLKITNDYKPCLRAFPRQLYSIVLSQARRKAKSVCATKESRTELIDSLKCITNDTFKDAAQIGHDITSFVNYLVSIPDINKVIPSLCCGYHIVEANAKAIVDHLCTDQGVGESGSKYLISLIKSTISDALDMMCGGYSTMEICESKVPILLEDIKIAQNNTFGMIYNHSAVVPILKMINRIDTETNLKQ